MTTLPQTTTPMRIPRGTNAITIPGTGGPGGGGMMPPTMQPQQPFTPGDIWRIIRANSWIIISLLIVSAVAGYCINQFWLDRYYRKYTASGLIEVQTNVSNNPITGTQQQQDLNAIGYEVRTQVQLLRHNSLLSRVFENANGRIRNTTWYQQFNGNTTEAKRELSEDLEVAVIPDSKLIQVSMSYSVPSDCTDIVMDIIDQHIKTQRRGLQDEQTERTRILQDMRANYDRQLIDLAASMRDKQQILNMDEMGVPGRLGIKEMKMQSLVAEQLQKQMMADGYRAQLNTMTQQNQKGEIPAMIKVQVDRDPLVVDLDRMYASESMGVSEGGSSHPRVLGQQQRLANLRTKLDEVRSQKLHDAMVAATEELQSEISEAEQGYKTISTEVEKMKGEMAALTNTMSVYLTDKDNEKLLREKKKDVDDSLEMINVVRNQQSNSTVQWAQLPQTPETPSFPKLKLTMAAAIALGLALSVGIAFLREVADTTIRSPRDIHRIGNMNFLGMIPHESDDPQATGSRLPLVIFDAPASMMADQLRQVRTRLQYAASLDTTRSILVTSPGPNDGKTVVACNLAAGLALNGRRILIVDADFRRPALHKVFEIEIGKGFTDALQNIDTFEECVRETAVPNLSVLTSGTKTGNSTELLESQLLVDFIERALEDFDHVIFDSGSIMVVSEAIALAPRVDGVVTVVRARSNSRGLLQRMRDTLRQLKAEHLGIILNAVRAQGGGYYGRNIKTYYAYQDNA